MNVRTIFAALVIATGASAQPAFEVASVKPATLQPGQGSKMTGGPGTTDPGRISYLGVTLSALLQKAYAILPDQISGPGWLDSERYSVIASLPPGTSADQFNLMLQNLLTERFKLGFHWDKKDLTVYELIVAPGGSKMKPAEAAQSSGDDGATPQIGPYAQDAQGCPVMRPGAVGLSGAWGPGNQCASFRNYSMEEITKWLEAFVPFVSGELIAAGVRVHVVDKTGLTGQYDGKLRFHFQPVFPGAAARAEDPEDITLFTALQKDLGLKLERRKLPFDTLVLDRVERVPVAN